MANKTTTIKRACILSVGQELLDGKIQDTNATAISEWLYKAGISVLRRFTANDDINEIAGILKNNAKDCDLIFVSGGLGPTHDDVTRDGVAGFLGRSVEFSQEMWQQVAGIFEERGMIPADTNKRQAYLIQGGEIIPNAMGTAPGMFIKDSERFVAVLPGPPRENIPMVQGWLTERLIKEGVFAQQQEKIVRLYGIGESDLMVIIQEFNPDFTFGCYFKQGGWLELHFPQPTDQTDALLSHIASKDIFITEDRSLSLLVLEEATKQGLKIGFAESLTGGHISAEIVENSGASTALAGSIVAYSNSVKENVLKVPGKVLDEHGAVSEPTAKYMAEGAAGLLETDIAVSATGVAGPAGGSKEKPVGMVCFGFCINGKTKTVTRNFFGQRDRVIRRAVVYVYVKLLQLLKGEWP